MSRQQIRRYPGLYYFTTEQREQFFGREEEKDVTRRSRVREAKRARGVGAHTKPSARTELSEDAQEARPRTAPNRPAETRPHTETIRRRTNGSPRRTQSRRACS